MTAVLVIDSDAALRRTLALLLTADGMNCIEAADIAAGVQLCVAVAPNVTLLAIDSEESEFVSTPRQLRAVTGEPIILMIAQHQMALVHRALENGANDYIVKPFSAVHLHRKIHTVIRHSNAEGDLPTERIQLD